MKASEYIIWLQALIIEHGISTVSQMTLGRLLLERRPQLYAQK